MSETPMVPANYAAELAREAAEIQKRIAAPSGDRIKTNGSKEFITPDGASGMPLYGVVVEFVSTNTYYDTPFQQDSVSPPACFAIGLEPSLMAPSPSSPVKQAETCGVCPQNQFGSAPNGRGKACRNQRLLALIPAPADKPALNEEGAETSKPVWLLSVPPTSIKAYDGYVAKLRSNRTVPTGVVTKISMDPAITYANMQFDVVRALDPAELPVYMSRKREALDRLTVEPDVSQYQPPRKPGAKVTRK